jgi:hypothetical protein
MDDARARALLGVAPDATTDDVRAAYRRLVRRHHPDLAGPSAATTRRTVELNEAYAAVVAAGPHPTASPAPEAEPEPEPRVDPFDIANDADGILPVAGATLEVFNSLCEAADTIGDLSYVDRANAILETIISPATGPTCSLMVTLQTTGADTLAYCTLESFDSRPGPPIDEVVAALSAELARRSPA